MNIKKCAHPALDSLKILICATPKSGNTWLKIALSHIYDLDIVEVEEDNGGISNMLQLPRCIAHAHALPSAPLVNLLRDHGIIPVTIVRHPVDVFVSLFHFVRARGERAASLEERCLLGDPNEMGSGAIKFVNDYFPKQLLVSQMWRQQGAPCARYEEMIKNPIDALKSLTDNIVPAEINSIISASTLCRIDDMRRNAGKSEYFFRAGVAGNGVNSVPPEILEIFNSEKYAKIFSLLSYPVYPEQVTPFDYNSIDPFQGKWAFDNGMQIVAPLKKLLLRHFPDFSERWPCPWEVGGGDTLFEWMTDLNESGDSGFRITNLLRAIYDSRVDLQQIMPLGSESGKIELALWFICHGQAEYGLNGDLLMPMISQLSALPSEPVEPEPSAFLEINLLDVEGRSRREFSAGEQVLLRYTIRAPWAMQPVFGMSIRNLDDTTLYALHSSMGDTHAPFMEKDEQITIEVPLALNLFSGKYYISVALNHIVDGSINLIERRSRAVKIDIYNSQGEGVINCGGDMKFIKDSNTPPA